MTIRHHSLPTPESIYDPSDLSDEDQAILNLYNLLNRDEFDSVDGIDLIDDILSEFTDQECITVYDDGELIAVANVRWEADKDQAWVERIVVTPEYRGQSVGTELMKYIDELRRHRSLGYTALMPVENAKGFYRKLGFDEVEHKTHPSKPIIMRKSS